MSLVVTLTGSPNAGSRTAQLAQHVGVALAADGFEVQAINVRDLPADDLIAARSDSAALRAPLALIERARGVVVATPIYKASYTGVLKSFLDLLPQFGLAGKVVLPLATGGTPAHVLAIDYALRPVLSCLGAQHVVNGLFVHDKLIEHQPATGGIRLDLDIQGRLDGVVAEFAASLRRSASAAAENGWTSVPVVRAPSDPLSPLRERQG
jgi:FMN reductase